MNIVATAVLDLAGLNNKKDSTSSIDQPDESSVVYHIVNPRLFRWTHDLLPALRDSGLEFETVSQREWVRRLRESDKDPETNPTIKLLDFFEEKYDNDKPGREGLVFLTERTGRRSEVIRSGYDVVESGLVHKFVDSWRREW